MLLLRWLPIAAQWLFLVQHQSFIHSRQRKSCFVTLCTTTTTNSAQNIDIDPIALEIVPLESVLNFRRALPGTNLPIYRCAAFDNASINDVVRLQAISTIIDLRNTDEIVKGYEKRSFHGAVAFYSSFKVVLDSIKSSGDLMRARSYGRSFESIIGDLFYATAATTDATGATATTIDSTTNTATGAILQQTTRNRRKTIYQLPVFGESQAFWNTIDRLSPSYQTPASTPPSSNWLGLGIGLPNGLQSGWKELFDPDASRIRLEKTLMEGGLPLLYEAMLEVSSKRLAAAMFLVLLVCEEYVGISTRASFSDNAQKTGLGRDLRPARGLGSASSRASREGLVLEHGSLVFHCAQGKDRTGLLALLLTYAIYDDTPETEAKVLREYSASAQLLPTRSLADRPATTDRDTQVIRQVMQNDRERTNAAIATNNNNINNININNNNNKKNERLVNLADVSSLQGAPPSAITELLIRLRVRYGSVVGYLDNIGFTAEYRQKLRQCAVIASSASSSSPSTLSTS